MAVNTMPTMSAEDQANIANYQKMYNDAVAAGDTNEAALAHINAEGVRKKYGYSGGVDGSQYIPDASSSNGSSSDQYIQEMYDQMIQAKQAALKSAYDQNVLAAQAAKAAIPGTYNDARNSTAATAAVNESNFNESAAASGLNSGAGGQAKLAMNNTLQGNMSNLDKQQAKDTAAVDLQMAQLQAKYQSDIASAIADGKFQQAQALYNKYMTDQQNAREDKQFREQMDYSKSNSEYNKTAAKAQQLAQYGDFSGYKALGYSDDDIASMQASYLLGNPKSGVGNKRYSIYKFAYSLKNQGMTPEQIRNGLQSYVTNGDITADDAQSLVSLISI